MQLETLDGKKQKKFDLGNIFGNQKGKFHLGNIFGNQKIYPKETTCIGLYYEKTCVIILKYSLSVIQNWAFTQLFKGQVLLIIFQAKGSLEHLLQNALVINATVINMK